jgi:histidyl-tRNA synthetase
MRALGFERFTIHVNNRLVLNGLLEELGLASHTAGLLRVLDKLPKDGADAVLTEMVEKTQIQPEQARRVLALAQTEGSNAEILERVQRDFGGNARVAEGVRRLRELVDVTAKAGMPPERVRLDVTIARGLDYYTGTVFETFLADLPTIGSVCSGGRYDNLTKLFTKQELPGVGASLGLDRLLAAMEEMKLLPTAATPAPVFVIQFDATRLGEYQAMARVLRAEGIGALVFPEAKKVGQQLQYAEKHGFRVALIAGSQEFEQGVWKVKNLATRAEITVAQAAVVAAVRSALKT